MKDTLYVQNGEIIVKEKQLNARPFRPIKTDKNLLGPDTFMTIDIETVLVEGIQTPYLICGYTNGNYIHSYTTDLSKEGQALMFKNFITQLLENKEIKYIYAHNLSGFDGILLMRHLIEFEGATANPLIFNGKLISINFDYTDPNNNTTRSLIFKDSYLLLPLPLRILCTAFNVSTPKTYFPFLLTDINYKGTFPSYDLFNNLTHTEYDILKNEHGNNPFKLRLCFIKRKKKKKELV